MHKLPWKCRLSPCCMHAELSSMFWVLVCIFSHNLEINVVQYCKWHPISSVISYTALMLLFGWECFRWYSNWKYSIRANWTSFAHQTSFPHHTDTYFIFSSHCKWLLLVYILDIWYVLCRMWQFNIVYMTYSLGQTI